MSKNRIYVFFSLLIIISALLIFPASADDNETATEDTTAATTEPTAEPTTATSTIGMTLTPGDTWDDYPELDFSGSISGGTADSWNWDFGDDTTETGISGTHTYSSAGTYTVILTVTSSDSTVSNTPYSQGITISEPELTASADITTYSGSLEISFEDETEGDIESWSWDFGDDEGTSDEQSGSYEYNDFGDYTIILTVTSENGQTDTYEEEISLQGLTAYFSADITSGGAPLTVEFTDESEENPYTDADIVEWYWEFGDDDDSYYHAYEDDDDDPDTEFTYEDEGTYTVTLTVTDEDGYEDSYEMTITVDDDLCPTADFSIDDDYETSGSAPLTVYFIDESEVSDDSESDLASWYWEFLDGDGDLYKYSYSQNPSVTFYDSGTYKVVLTVTDEDGMSDTITEEDYIEVTLDLSATFTASPSSGYLPLTVNFYATAGSGNDYDIENYYWYFGDGYSNSVSDDTVSHTYTSAGNYDVKLVVTDEEGNTYTYTKDNCITVKEVISATAAATPVANTVQEEAAKSSEDSAVSAASSGTKIFGIGGTEYFRFEMTRFYNFYEEYLSLMACIFGIS